MHKRWSAFQGKVCNHLLHPNTSFSDLLNVLGTHFLNVAIPLGWILSYYCSIMNHSIAKKYIGILSFN